MENAGDTLSKPIIFDVHSLIFGGVFFSNFLGSKSICRLKIYHWHSGNVDMPCMSLLNDI